MYFHMQVIFIIRFYIFERHSTADRAEARGSEIIGLILKILLDKWIFSIMCCRRKRTISLCVFGKNAQFRSGFSPKTHLFRFTSEYAV
jgi:hypothetical protein